MPAIKWEEMPEVPASEIRREGTRVIIRTDVAAAVRRINEARTHATADAALPSPQPRAKYEG